MWKVQIVFVFFISMCSDSRTQNTTDSFDPEDIENVTLEIFGYCKCVIYTKCTNGYINTDGINLIQPRSGSGERPKCKGGDFEGQYVCCRVIGQESETTSDSTSLKESSVIPPIETDLPKRSCGSQKILINNRILVDENDSTIPMDGEFPWMAAIYKKEPSGNYRFYCSGSLITPKVILTSNHYFVEKMPDQFKVIVNGKSDLTAIGDKVEEERDVIEIINHQHFKRGTLKYDAALLVLNNNFDLTKNLINTICLPSLEINLEGTKCFVAGWGKGSEEQGVKVMKKVELPFVNFTTCQDLLRKTRLGPRFNLHKTFMCAGGEEGKDACKGDGGSPLMCPKPGSDNYYIAGIVSWGIGCGTANVPGVYANVQQVKGWIVRELTQRQIPIDLD